MSGIFPHNSDKCHCPACEEIRGQVRDLARREVNAKSFDDACRVERLRDAARARAREAYLNETERSTGFDKWRAERREQLRQRQAVRDRVYYSSVHGCHWRWRYFAGEGWMKVTVKTGRPLNANRFRKVEFTPEGYKAYHMSGPRPWQRPETVEIEDRFKFGRAAATEHTVTKKVGELSETTTDRIEFSDDLKSAWVTNEVPAWADGLPTLKIEVDAATGKLDTSYIGGGAKTGADAENDPINLEQEASLTALQLSILLWRAAHTGREANTGGMRYPFHTAANVDGAMRSLEAWKLIQFNAEHDNFILTDRANVLVSAIRSLPLPVQPQPKWEMPS